MIRVPLHVIDAYARVCQDDVPARLHPEGQPALPGRQGAEHRQLLAAAVGARVPDGGDAAGLHDGRHRPADDPARAADARRALPRETGGRLGAVSVIAASLPPRAAGISGPRGSRVVIFSRSRPHTRGPLH